MTQGHRLRNSLTRKNERTEVRASPSHAFYPNANLIRNLRPLLSHDFHLTLQLLYKYPYQVVTQRARLLNVRVCGNAYTVVLDNKLQIIIFKVFQRY